MNYKRCDIDIRLRAVTCNVSQYSYPGSKEFYDSCRLCSPVTGRCIEQHRTILTRPLMTPIALWEPAFPPAPTSIVRKNVTARCRFKRPCEPQVAPSDTRQSDPGNTPSSSASSVPAAADRHQAVLAMPHCHHRLSPDTNQVLRCWRSAATAAPATTACRQARRSNGPATRKPAQTRHHM